MPKISPSPVIATFVAPTAATTAHGGAKSVGFPEATSRAPFSSRSSTFDLRNSPPVGWSPLGTATTPPPRAAAASIAACHFAVSSSPSAADAAAMYAAAAHSTHLFIVVLLDSICTYPRTNPSSSRAPRTRFRFWIAAPEAPLPRLSKRETSTARSAVP